MRLSKHFKLSEFVCNCSCKRPNPKDPGDAVLISNLRHLCTQALEPLRAHLQTPIRVTSGFRCPTHNREVGGAIKSLHLQGKAADITAKGLPQSIVWQAVLTLQAKGVIGGVGLYRDFVHIDTGPCRVWRRKH